MRLLCWIYDSKCFGNSSNHGISEVHDSVIISWDEKNPPTEANGKPIVKLVRRSTGVGEYLHVEPVEKPRKGYVGWMAGGSFVYTGDSRFPADYPIPLHDRQDTQEDYNLLTR